MSYGLSFCGYDVRIDKKTRVAGRGFMLASTLEQFDMPLDLMGVVHDKSTLARMGLTVQNTVIEPGWCGYLTLELTNHDIDSIWLDEGQPIAQVIFHVLSSPVEKGYSGKYQNQQRGPQEARFERDKP